MPGPASFVFAIFQLDPGDVIVSLKILAEKIRGDVNSKFDLYFAPGVYFEKNLASSVKLTFDEVLKHDDRKVTIIYLHFKIA